MNKHCLLYLALCVKFLNKVLKCCVSNKYVNNRTQFHLELILDLDQLPLDFFDIRRLRIKNNVLQIFCSLSFVFNIFNDKDL